MKPLQLNCLNCLKGLNDKQRKYCSSVCTYTYWHKLSRSPKSKLEKSCAICKKGFSSNQPFAKYCSAKCRVVAWQPEKTKWAIPTGSVGTVGELLVSADLLLKGYEVYRALSPSASCDILALQNGNIYKFEVRTGYYKNDKILYGVQNVKAPNIAVITFSDNKIHYFPEVFI